MYRGNPEALFFRAPFGDSGAAAVVETPSQEQLREESLRRIRDIIGRFNPHRAALVEISAINAQSSRRAASLLQEAAIPEIPFIVAGSFQKSPHVTVDVTDSTEEGGVLVVDYYGVSKDASTRNYKVPTRRDDGTYDMRALSYFGTHLRFGINQEDEFVPVAYVSRYGDLHLVQSVLPKGGFEALKAGDPLQIEPRSLYERIVPSRPPQVVDPLGKEHFNPLDQSRMVIPNLPPKDHVVSQPVVVDGVLDRNGRWKEKGKGGNFIGQDPRFSKPKGAEKGKGNNGKRKSGGVDSKHTYEAPGRQRTAGSIIEKKDRSDSFKKRR